MSAIVVAWRGATGEVAKIPAFIRRDWLVMLSYRAAFVSDLVTIAIQAVLFSFIERLIDPATMPAYDGTRAGYLEFALLGVIVSLVTGLMLSRVATAVRQEQMIGTFESLLSTPTRPTTVQAGSVAFDLLFIPLRMGLLLVAVAFTFSLHFHAGGVLPALVVLAGYVPFVWGLGLMSAGAMVTFRRGAGLLGAGVGALGIISGAFFPLALLPDWLQAIAEANPVAIAIETVRETLIGGGGWSAIPGEAALLVPASIAALAGGVLAFRAALARERRKGTLGLY
ncbi:MAG TPA: ABC transporter permease [Solirubrobacteraceae bacterium]|nr:ABC transporter permease [Solirubrobacteraceae bacterium]